MKTIRFCCGHGVTATWRIGKNKEGRYKVMGLSKPKVGRNPIPLDFVPFAMMDAVLNKHAPTFETEAECEAYVRGI